MWTVGGRDGELLGPRRGRGGGGTTTTRPQCLLLYNIIGFTTLFYFDFHPLRHAPPRPFPLHAHNLSSMDTRCDITQQGGGGSWSKVKRGKTEAQNTKHKQKKKKLYGYHIFLCIFLRTIKKIRTKIRRID